MENVILVNVNDQALGIMEKMEAHEKGELHRAFSIFIFNSNGEMLLQKRSVTKYHSAGLWTNACCSHPRENEETLNAACRRLKEELGFETPIKKVFDFIYNAQFDNGLMEHEYDHVFVGRYDGIIIPNVDEVEQFKYTPMAEIKKLLLDDPAAFTAWFHIAFPKIESWYNLNN